MEREGKCAIIDGGRCLVAYSTSSSTEDLSEKGRGGDQHDGIAPANKRSHDCMFIIIKYLAACILQL